MLHTRNNTLVEFFRIKSTDPGETFLVEGRAWAKALRQAIALSTRE